MTKDGLERFWLTGLLSWDTDDLSSSSSADAGECRVSGLPSVFSDISVEQLWLEEATRTERV